MTWSTHPSEQDASVNHSHPAADGGLWEARYVQRTDDYFIAYLSSHTGCSQSCRFCHLTATGQTWMMPASQEHYVQQTEQVLTTYRQRLEQGMPPVQWAHVNFMARGEPLLNPTLCTDGEALYERLAACFSRAGVEDVRFKVSTILPRDFPATADALEQALIDPRAMLYYSLYSLDPRFRKRWLPKAHDPAVALDAVAEYQARTGRPVALHWAFIEGANDRDEDVDAIAEAVLKRGIRAKFNLVRYNPFGPRLGQEPPEDRVTALFDRLAGHLGEQRSRIVPRVGFDVKASCGMFLNHTA